MVAEPAAGDRRLGLIFVTADNVDTILAATDPASPRAAPTGLDVPIGDLSRKDQEYVWISNASNLPLFVERVYPGLESARKALNVNVRIAARRRSTSPRSSPPSMPSAPRTRPA